MSYDPAAAFNDGYDLAMEHVAEEWEPLLSAARDALRNYQYGNGSPILAKEIADKIDRQLEIQKSTVEPPPYNKLRAALVGLVGVGTVDELRQLEATLRLMPAPAEDKAAMIDAIHVLIETDKLFR